MKNGFKIVIIILGLFLYLFVKIVHDRTYIEYGRLMRKEMQLTQKEEGYKHTCDSLKTFNRIVGIAKGELNMVFPRGNQKKVID